MKKNLMALIFWQISQYIIPLITFPYLARVLGVGQFGALSIATGIIGYILVVTEWGFALTATQKVAQSLNDFAKLQLIFWETILAKVLIAIPVTAVAIIVVFNVPILRDIRQTFLVSTIQVLANALTVSWFLQGKEDMVGFSLASFVGRLVIVPLIFLLVHKPSDLMLSAGLQSAGVLITAIISLYLVRRTIPIFSPRFTFGGIRNQLEEGWHVFLSQAAASLYAQGNVLVVGMICGDVQAGIYSGGDRIRRAAQGVMTPLSTALYPRISSLALSDRNAALDLARKGFLTQLLSATFLSLILWWSAPYLVNILLGRQFYSTIMIVQVLAILPIFVSTSNSMGIQVMLSFGLRKEFSYIILASGILNLIILLPLAVYYGAVGGAVALVSTEVLIAVAMLLMVAKKLGSRAIPFICRHD